MSKPFKKSLVNKAAGFSLIELLIAMTITLVIMGLSSALLAGAFNIRSRENLKSDALSDAQRALNIMSREIAGAGFDQTQTLNLGNGIITGDSDASSIRIRADLNGDQSINAPDEDVKYLLYVDTPNAQSFVVRYDVRTRATTILADRIDTLGIHYYATKIDYATQGATTPEVAPNAAKFIVLFVGVTLPAVGRPGVSGYQPPSQVQLVSDVALRNTNLRKY